MLLNQMAPNRTWNFIRIPALTLSLAKSVATGSTQASVADKQR